MKKEINLKNKKLELNFFYDSRSLGAKDIKLLIKWLSYFIEAIETFIFKGELKNIVKKHQIKKISVNFSLCGNYKIKSLNKSFRNKDKVTDVLSFPLHDDFRNNFVDVFFSEIELGDIYISKDVCLKQAKEFGLTFEEEFVHLLTHGLLHLLGYDHEINEDEEKLMFDFEEKILKTISKTMKFK